MIAKCSNCFQNYDIDMNFCPHCGQKKKEQPNETPYQSNKLVAMKEKILGFGGFLDTDNPAKKLKKEIESTKFKMQSLISTVQREIQETNQKISAVFYQIGKQAYESRNDDTATELDHTALFIEIDTLKVIISEKEQKITEIKNRYEDEISIMSRMLNQIAAPVPEPNQCTCPKCGNGYTPEVDNFCDSCGYCLSGELSSYDDPLEPPDRQEYAYCGECGSEFIVGQDIFCSNCGYELE